MVVSDKSDISPITIDFSIKKDFCNKIWEVVKNDKIINTYHFKLGKINYMYVRDSNGKLLSKSKFILSSTRVVLENDDLIFCEGFHIIRDSYSIVNTKLGKCTNLSFRYKVGIAPRTYLFRFVS